MSYRRTLRRFYKWGISILSSIITIFAVNFSEGRLISDGFIFDVLLSIHHALDLNQKSAKNPVVVIAIDERTLEASELRDLPRVFFGPYFAKMMDAVFEADAAALGFDLLFSYDSGRFDPKWSAPFYAAIEKYRDKVVLGRSARITPALPILLQVPDDAVGLLELPRDLDGVDRRLLAAFKTVSGESIETFVKIVLNRVASPMPAELRIWPAWHLETIPTYALIDVLRCYQSGPKELQEVFRNKIVLVGSTLPEEDRRLPPSRFVPPPEVSDGNPVVSSGCLLQPLPPSDPSSRTVPGVHIHAAGIETVMTDRLLKKTGTAVIAGVAIISVILGISLALNTNLLTVLLGLIFAASMLLVTSGILLVFGYWLPVSAAIIGLLAAAGIGYGARFAVEERRRRWIQNAFGQYLAPTIVNEIAEADHEPQLGGERREVTVMFADLSGFTALSERIPPSELMELTNYYLGLIVEQVELTGGYIDKFIGDAVMAIWGAPIDNLNHAQNGVKTALEIQLRVNSARKVATANGKPGFGVKVGLNSGFAIIGNVGSRERLSYTALGETVNVAARFESLPRDYGCTVIIGEATANAIDGIFPVYELDLVKVKGLSDTQKIFEPLATQTDYIDYKNSYTKALEAYRGRRFRDAARIWFKLHYPGDAPEPNGLTPNRVMADRATILQNSPPPNNWGGEWIHEKK